jgi:hypothetical protein
MTTDDPHIRQHHAHGAAKTPRLAALLQYLVRSTVCEPPLARVTQMRRAKAWLHTMIDSKHHSHCGDYCLNHNHQSLQQHGTIRPSEIRRGA